MAIPVTMPKLGLTMTVGAVAQWNAAEGECVSTGDIIVEVMTEKITYQVECPVDGILLSIIVPEGTEVPVGATIGVVGEPGEDIATLLVGKPNGGAYAPPGDQSPPADGDRPRDEDVTHPGSGTRVAASPAARKLAQERGVDLSRVDGTGPGGRITLEDVRAAGAAAVALPVEQAAPAAAEEIAYAGVRRAIGEHMALSWTTTPMVTHHVRADVHELVRTLAQANERRAEREKISVTAAVVKAAAAAIKVVPGMNASLEGDTIRLWPDVNIGVAVAVPGGLLVPVIKNADGKTLGQISAEVARLARRARKNRLLPDDVSGGTFTVTSLSGYASVDWFTPIINQPEAAILGVGRVVDDVVAVDGVPAVRPTMGLSLTFDHRIVDGAPAAEFLRALLSYLENPVLMLV